MEPLPPIKPAPPETGPKLQAPAGHGTAKAGTRTGPMHPHCLVVSLHDVSPRTRAACETILSDLALLGVPRCSLLVVPDHHAEGHFLDDPGFCEWLCRCATEGHELVIHGYYHQRARREEESLATQVTTRFYTADEGEFFDLDEAEALELVLQAREDFRELGLSPDGFIAPAWLLSAAAEAGVKEAGCQYTTRLGTITDLQTGRQWRSQSLCWSVRSAWRRMSSLAWNSVLFRLLRSNQLLRVSIHPVDLLHGRVWRQIRHLISLALHDRAPYTYERWITRERAFRLMTRQA